MARYTVRWLTYAEQLRDSLPPAGRRELDQLLDQLTADPRQHSTCDKYSEQWTAAFGAYGVLLYSIEDNLHTITVLRVTWSG
ncbi:MULTISPECIES: type II toxin-antitoxin system RelE family toxin [unclassified Frankia]|uniref:type II toxin-antitoxin system RelE family toxin n=1 Tax=unclassified Frankia TaxID=2632575 RepID=UPI0020243B01